MTPNNESLDQEAQEAFENLSPRDHLLQTMSYQEYLQTPEWRQIRDGKPSQRENTLQSMPYQEYLQTHHWKSLREEKLRQEQYTCQICNASGVTLNVHHRTYERRGHEALSDLVVLCQDCHEIFHTHGKLAQYDLGAKPASHNKPPELDFVLYPDELKRYAFSNFKTMISHYDDSLPTLKDVFDRAARAAQILEKCLKNGDPIDEWIVFIGGHGTGKTHLLASICNYLRLNGIECGMIATVSFSLWLQSCQMRNQDYYPLLQKLREVPFLVLEDIGREKHSEFREKIYYHIIDGRVERGLPTALSAHSAVQMAETLSGATCSRLSLGSVYVKMPNLDYRRIPSNRATMAF